ncbi:hypothetical protein DM02DRAFT_635566 [Periconia macrospinosa]|uniref:Uncharacterized protein n=1 Tax=Periconia macrospinosa TaxID=97972 RepID=A0A2V1D2D8_9PLEO|nr:hypothetical protein DM02DRAFT_635566 [Periconia macrospinosa]
MTNLKKQRSFSRQKRNGLNETEREVVLTRHSRPQNRPSKEKAAKSWIGVGGRRTKGFSVAHARAYEHLLNAEGSFGNPERRADVKQPWKTWASSLILPRPQRRINFRINFRITNNSNSSHNDNDHRLVSQFRQNPIHDQRKTSYCDGALDMLPHNGQYSDVMNTRAINRILDRIDDRGAVIKARLR